MGLPVVERLEKQSHIYGGTYVFPATRSDGPFGNFPKQWKQILAGSTLSDITAHVLRHSFASVANDLGFSEITIAALLGHATGSMTSKYVHTLDTTLIMAADTVSGYIQGLLEGQEFQQTASGLDRGARQAAINQFLSQSMTP